MLAKGSELGWAHNPSAPDERIASRVRACAGPDSPMTAPTTSGRTVFIPRPRIDGSGLGDSSLARLQGADVVDDLVDLRVGEGPAEGRIAPDLPFLMRLCRNSSSRGEFISRGPSPAARPPAEWTKAAGPREQLLDVECPVVGCRGGRLRSNRCSREQRGAQHRR